MSNKLLYCKRRDKRLDKNTNIINKYIKICIGIYTGMRLLLLFYLSLNKYTFNLIRHTYIKSRIFLVLK